MSKHKYSKIRHVCTPPTRSITRPLEFSELYKGVFDDTLSDHIADCLEYVSSDPSEANAEQAMRDVEYLFYDRYATLATKTDEYVKSEARNRNERRGFKKQSERFLKIVRDDIASHKCSFDRNLKVITQ